MFSHRILNLNVPLRQHDLIVHSHYEVFGLCLGDELVGVFVPVSVQVEPFHQVIVYLVGHLSAGDKALF